MKRSPVSICEIRLPLAHPHVPCTMGMPLSLSSLKRTEANLSISRLQYKPNCRNEDYLIVGEQVDDELASI